MDIEHNQRSDCILHVAKHDCKHAWQDEGNRKNRRWLFAVLQQLSGACRATEQYALSCSDDMSCNTLPTA